MVRVEDSFPRIWTARPSTATRRGVFGGAGGGRPLGGGGSPGEAPPREGPGRTLGPDPPSPRPTTSCSWGRQFMWAGDPGRPPARPRGLREGGGKINPGYAAAWTGVSRAIHRDPVVGPGRSGTAPEGPGGSRQGGRPRSRRAQRLHHALLGPEETPVRLGRCACGPGHGRTTRPGGRGNRRASRRAARGTGAGGRGDPARPIGRGTRPPQPRSLDVARGGVRGRGELRSRRAGPGTGPGDRTWRRGRELERVRPARRRRSPGRRWPWRSGRPSNGSSSRARRSPSTISGRAKESKAALDALVERWADGFALQVAEVHAWRGDPDRAFEWLERAYTQRDSGMLWLQTDPFLRKLHRERRWMPFLRKMTLPGDSAG